MPPAIPWCSPSRTAYATAGPERRWRTRSLTDALDDGRVGPPVRVLGIPCEYIAHGKPDVILHELGLDGEGIAAEAHRLLTLLSPSA